MNRPTVGKLILLLNIVLLTACSSTKTRTDIVYMLPETIENRLLFNIKRTCNIATDCFSAEECKNGVCEADVDELLMLLPRVTETEGQ